MYATAELQKAMDKLRNSQYREMTGSVAKLAIGRLIVAGHAKYELGYNQSNKQAYVIFRDAPQRMVSASNYQNLLKKLIQEIHGQGLARVSWAMLIWAQSNKTF